MKGEFEASKWLALLGVVALVICAYSFLTQASSVPETNTVGVEIDEGVSFQYSDGVEIKVSGGNCVVERVR